MHARKRAEEKKCHRAGQGTDGRGDQGDEVLPGRSHQERKERLYPLLREIEQEQNEHKRISWGMVRIVHSMELVVVENALKSILRDDEAPIWLYQAARDYAERYDPRHGTGLIPSSAPMMQEIADFWRDYFGIGRSGGHNHWDALIQDETTHPVTSGYLGTSRETASRLGGRRMPFPVDVSLIQEAERQLGRKLPPDHRVRLHRLNGGNIQAVGDYWNLFPVWDSTDRRRMTRTANHIVRETKAARKERQGFPEIP